MLSLEKFSGYISKKMQERFQRTDVLEETRWEVSAFIKKRGGGARDRLQVTDLDASRVESHNEDLSIEFFS